MVTEGSLRCLKSYCKVSEVCLKSLGCHMSGMFLTHLEVD